MTHPEPSQYAWWLAGRSAGIVAMMLVTASVLLGLGMAARAIPRGRRAEAVRLHEHLALLALLAIAAHGVMLAADPWLRAGPGIAVPFGLSYRPVWTGLGVIGGYLAAALGLSFYLRRRIGARLWRRMHRLTVVVYVLGLIHSLGAGTDSATRGFRYAMLASALPVVFLFVLRLQRSRPQRRARARAPVARVARRAPPPSQAPETGAADLASELPQARGSAHLHASASRAG